MSCRLTETPLFRQTCWRTQALLDGSWAHLPPDALGNDHAKFLAALKEMDAVAVPQSSIPGNDDSDFRVALRLDPGTKQSSYNNGRALAWACLVHFQVLDLILATNFQRLTQPAVVTPIHPSLNEATAALRLIKPLCGWTTHVKGFIEELNHDDGAPGEEIQLPSSVVESLAPVLAFSKIDNKTRKAKALKNLQAIAAGLVWVLELGSENAPLLTNQKKLAIAPLRPIPERYTNLAASTNEAAKAVRGLKTTPANLLRPLSYVLNSTLALIFCDQDLSTMHVDMDIEQEIAHCLLVAGPRPKSLLYVEEYAYGLIRASSGKLSAERIAVENKQYLAGMPGIAPQDADIFCGIRDRYKNSASQARMMHLPTTVFRPSTSGFPFLIWPRPEGRIARALSQAPSLDLSEMVLVSDLPVSDAHLFRAQPPPTAIDLAQSTPLASEIPILAAPQFDSAVSTTHNAPATANKAANTANGSAVNGVQNQATDTDTAVSDKSRGFAVNTGPMESLQPSSSGGDGFDAIIGTGSKETSTLEVPTRDTAEPIEKLAAGKDNEAQEHIGATANINASDSTSAKSGSSQAGTEPLPSSTDGTAADNNVKSIDQRLESSTAMDLDTQLRRSARVKAAHENPPEATQLVPPTASKPLKRRGPTGSNRMSVKKAKVMDNDETDINAELESSDDMEVDNAEDLESVGESETPNLTSIDVDEIERCETPFRVSALLPDGNSRTEFAYFGHPASRETEYKLLFDVNQSATALPNSSLQFFSLAEWDGMPNTARVQSWKSGRDIYISGLRAGPKLHDIAAVYDELTIFNRMDAPIDVQVQAKRIFPGDDLNAGVDYTKSIYTTTLDTMVDHATRSDGLVLNALNLPGGHFIHTNPLLGTGFDLDMTAYTKTNGLPGFKIKYPPYEETYFRLFGLTHALSMFHIDIAMTWIYVAGPGDKFWVCSCSQNGGDDLTDSHDFDNWDPDRVSLHSHDYEITALPAGGGILLQQPGRRHAVIGTGTADQHGVIQPATLTIGGYFFCASRLRAAMAVILHTCIQSHLLSNADHVGLWQIYIRIAMFWLHTTSEHRREQEALAAYLPDLSLSTAHGWLDIIYLACLVLLLPCLDNRNYGDAGTPGEELTEAAAVCNKYGQWRQWLAGTYIVCHRETGKQLDWEEDIFTPCLLNMAAVLQQYHARVLEDEPEAPIFKRFTLEAFNSNLRTAFASYNLALSKTYGTYRKENRTKFFLFQGDEFILKPY
ncbi:hypothetical protein MVEN_01568300 [Mycena venus]|uniref:JmjC domain-containing protein n=1 Tax=Mycena venus TaxID=2733690 RepID=A0A8H6XPD4_9AGAR|nr:hypothetical protein MVEN_01568300 [Mycena venus]